MFPPTEPWKPTINWEAPAGRFLRRFVETLPLERPFTIVVFGSAPLQLGIDPGLLSGDIDIISSFDFSEILAREGFDKNHSRDLYIDQCAENVFVAPVNWRERAHIEQVGKVSLILPHPIDILLSKIKRLEEKDLRAFRVVHDKTGHPTEAELRQELMKVVDIFRPAFDEENSGGDAALNTQRVWRELFGKTIDVRGEIIAPALKARAVGYGQGSVDYKKILSLL